MVFADGSSGRYDQVLACDGNRSTVRQALRLPFDGIDLPHEWGVADVSVVGSRYPASFALFMVENGAMVVVAPMAAGRVRVIANRPDPLALLPVPLDRRSTLAEGRFRI